MTESDYRIFDFREIAALDDTAVSLRNWVSKASSFFSEFWGQATGYGAQLALGEIRTETYGSLLGNIPQEDFCCLAEFDGHASTLWFASATEIRLSVAELLNLGDASELGEGELTPIEISLAQFFVDHLARALTDGWMGEERVSVSTTILEKDPRKTRIFRGSDLVTKTSISVELKLGQVVWHWLMPKQKTCDLLETAIDRRRGKKPNTPSQQMVEQLPMDIVSVLGRATVPMMDLSKIKPGQLIMLDQRIDQPVTAYINDSPFYSCWPGKLGKKQALEINNCLHQ